MTFQTNTEMKKAFVIPFLFLSGCFDTTTPDVKDPYRYVEYSHFLTKGVEVINVKHNLDTAQYSFMLRPQNGSLDYLNELKHSLPATNWRILFDDKSRLLVFRVGHFQKEQDVSIGKVVLLDSDLVYLSFERF